MKNAAASLGFCIIAIASLFALASPRCFANESGFLYQGGEKEEFLTIVRVDESRLARNELRTPLKGGKQLVMFAEGDVSSIVQRLLWRCDYPGADRLFPEAEDQAIYRVSLVQGFRLTVPVALKVIETLDLELVTSPRRRLAFVIRRDRDATENLMKFSGSPRWPEAFDKEIITKSGIPKLVRGKLVPWRLSTFPRGGVLFKRAKYDNAPSVIADDRYYYDGVSLDELAQDLESRARFPVVNQTGDSNLYSFVLPDDIKKRLVLNKTGMIGELGLTISTEHVAIDSLVLRRRSISQTEVSTRTAT